VLNLVDKALEALRHVAAPSSSVAAAAQKKLQAVQPHVDNLAAVAAAVKGAIWDVSSLAWVELLLVRQEIARLHQNMSELNCMTSTCIDTN
jgi:hypothetical protein